MKDTLLAVARNQRLPLTWCFYLGLEQLVLTPKYVVDLTNLVLLEMFATQSLSAIESLEHLRLHPFDMSLLILRDSRYDRARLILL